ncbi:MAG: hypothetical protein Q8N63_05745, partial [Nanoarchaeota archaeon]|nr:hypothetical protein [Nanoarchaeota archaeon]
LKYAGKTAAIIACPPLGLALLPKNGIYRALAACGGGVLSFLAGGLLINLSDKTLYDSPQVSVETSPVNFPRNMIELLTSPIALHFDTRDETSLEKDKISYNIVGDDVITFNNGEYQLNFGCERKFSAGNDYISVKQVGEQVTKYEKLLDAYRQKGDIFSARRAEGRLHWARKCLEKTTASYKATKAEFQAAVDGMNSELETLAQSK